MKQHRILVIDQTSRNPEFEGQYSYPRLRLQGKWLGRAGFKPGDKVKLYVTQNEIVVRKETTQ